MKYIIKSFIFISVVLPSIAFGQVIINEIAWMGVPVEGVDERQWWRYEFLELYNRGEEAVSLNGWIVELSREKVDLHVPLQGSVESQGYVVIAASPKVPGVDVNYGSLAGKFVNSGQRVVLKNATGEVGEEIDAVQGWFAGDNDTKLTMERRFLDRPANDPENWGSSMETGGTPKAENSMFGKEAFLKLAPLEARFFSEKKSAVSLADLPLTGWVSFLKVITNPVLMRAFLISLLSAIGLLLLRQYLLRSHLRGEDSYDALKD